MLQERTTRRSDRHGFRRHMLDGAILYFHPETGTYVRVESDATREFSRCAPRVVMFGITNACNLSCAFCSRDTARASTWTVESAERILAGLADAGTLEVAFGGGEPFAFAGLAELVVRLRARTRLALHVTTNGTLLDDTRLRSFEGGLGQVRLSLYDEVPWRPAAQVLLRAGQLWGANILVHDGALGVLPATLCELAALGAHDVSLLSYVGSDLAMTLSRAGEERLSSIISASPLPVRVSVCFGARLSVPRLWDGMGDDGDCGAGADFLSITPDRRAQSCSFQEDSFQIASAEDALMVWTRRREELRRASPRPGCARVDHAARERRRRDGLHVWRGFSGNNSGECMLVSRFESEADASRFLAELVPGFAAGEPYSAPWKELFDAERISAEEGASGSSPDEMITVGRTFLARTDYAPGDEFPELRALTWKRNGEVVPGGVHVHGHGSANVLGAIRAQDKHDAAALVAAAEGAGRVAAAHGSDVLVLITGAGRQKPAGAVETPLAWRRDELSDLAQGRPFAMELALEETDRGALTDVMKKLATPTADRTRLALGFWAYEDRSTPVERARTLAAELSGNVTRVQNIVLLDDIVRRKRGAVLGYGRNAWVTALGGGTVACSAQLAHPPQRPTKGKKTPPLPPLDAVALEPELRAHLRSSLSALPFDLYECGPETWGGRVRIRVHTSAPGEALAALASFAESRGLDAHLGVRDLDPLLRSARRLIEDLRMRR